MCLLWRSDPCVPCRPWEVEGAVLQACASSVCVCEAATRDGDGVKYRTIVADPPWDYLPPAKNSRNRVTYPTMLIEAICALPVGSLAENDSHLWLWTTAQWIWDAPRVCLSWGFKPSGYVLTWVKPGLGVGQRFRHTCEFIVFAERGAQLPVTRRDLPTHYEWPRGEHSQKPDGSYDLVESVSPGPYLELFARRQRLGWDTWGNEALNHVDLGQDPEQKLGNDEWDGTLPVPYGVLPY